MIRPAKTISEKIPAELSPVLDALGYDVLRRLCRYADLLSGGRLSLREIAGILRSFDQAYRVVNTLIALGLAESHREKCRHDPRNTCRYFYLTERGRAVVETCYEALGGDV
ncbi:MAG: hypothetical protein QXP97_07665 [Desulfurococcus sp.]|uniref:hypothetical protein n=1 Tax=Desulfurococcus sp. TaxID=51678 RepID=UPI003162AF37